MKKYNIGISSCLLGNKVRFDGGHKKHKIINDELSKYFSFMPFCPEVAIGLGVPRQTIRLVERENIIEVVNPKTNETHSKKMRHYAHSVSNQDFDGFLFKKDSPSCGAFRVKTFHPNGQRLHVNGIGAFAEQIMKNFPNMPVEEEGRLNDLGLKNNFINRVIMYGDLKEIESISELIQFHAENKYTLYSYNQLLSKELGRIIASNKKNDNFLDTKSHYLDLIMQGTIKPPKKGNQINAMLHIFGYLKKELDYKEKAEFLRFVEMYNKNEVPIIAPLSILRFLIKNKGNTYIKNQSYVSLEIN